MSCCHTKKLIMRTRLASDSLSHSADSFSLSLNLCRKQSISLSPSRSVCHSISVAISLSLNLCRNQSVSLSLPLNLCRHQSFSLSMSRLAQSANHKSVSHKPISRISHSSSHSVSQAINHQHTPAYPISTSLLRLDYYTQSVGHSLSIYLSN